MRRFMTLPNPRGSEPGTPQGPALRLLPSLAPTSSLENVVKFRGNDVRLRGLVDKHIDFVARVLRNAGTPESEIDDDLQRTFIAVSHRLDDIRHGAEKSFLLQIALRVAAHARRTLARRREVPVDEPPESAETSANPEQLTDQRRARIMLDRVLDQMPTDLRTVLILHEFEEMNTSEIADILEIPRGTVASRLRRARVTFRERVIALQGQGRPR